LIYIKVIHLQHFTIHRKSWEKGRYAMKLGYVSLPGRGANDLFLSDMVAALDKRLRLCGTVQTNTARADRRKCDMDLRLLSTGAILRISEDRGALARGCTLDTSVLAQAVAATEAALPGSDLLIVNKFGKTEAEGRGFAPVIAEALCLGIPVLVGVNGLNLPAFATFAEGLAEALPAEYPAILGWCLSAGLRHAA
jgi:nucleoside-triphosphatase THEP1